MTRKLALLAVLALATAGVARAEALDVIEVRQAGQDLLSGDFAGIRAVVAAKGDVKTLESGEGDGRWMRLYPTLFPKGSDQGHNTKALPTIWSRHGGLREVRRRDWRMRPTKMAEFAKAGDADGVAAQIKAVGDGCSACHRTYRAR